MTPFEICMLLRAIMRGQAEPDDMLWFNVGYAVEDQIIKWNNLWLITPEEEVEKHKRIDRWHHAWIQFREQARDML